MRCQTFRAWSLIAACQMFVSQGWSHHSTTMFDMTRKIEIRGTVLKFEWTNPHTWIQLQVNDAATGKNTEWSIEAPAVAGLQRIGWRADTLKVGESITVILHPLRAGGPGGALFEVVKADGTHLPQTIIQKVRDQSARQY